MRKEVDWGPLFFAPILPGAKARFERTPQVLCHVTRIPSEPLFKCHGCARLSCLCAGGSHGKSVDNSIDPLHRALCMKKSVEERMRAFCDLVVDYNQPDIKTNKAAVLDEFDRHFGGPSPWIETGPCNLSGTSYIRVTAESERRAVSPLGGSRDMTQRYCMLCQSSVPAYMVAEAESFVYRGCVFDYNRCVACVYGKLKNFPCMTSFLPDDKCAPPTIERCVSLVWVLRDQLPIELVTHIVLLMACPCAVQRARHKANKPLMRIFETW